MLLKGRYLNSVSFPVGGIGAGCIGLDGSGRFADWEIFNHPGKMQRNGCTHFAVRAEVGGKVVSARILNGDFRGDLTGNIGENGWRGYGFGPAAETLCGFPHFKHCELNGAFPAAEYRFSDPAFPGSVTLTAWSPFIPGESDTSSMPCGIFEIGFENPLDGPVTFYGIGVLSNPWAGEYAENQIISGNGTTSLVLKNNCNAAAFEYGEAALSTDCPGVSFQEYLFRGGWYDQLEVYMRDLNSCGDFADRTYSGKNTRNDNGLLAVPVTVAPGGKATVRFIISWFIPNCRNFWSDPETLQQDMAVSGIKENRWRNYYTRLCSSASDAAERIFADFDRIRDNVFTFRGAIHASTLPEAALQGAAENLSVLISPVCMRLEDGTFWGWEGARKNSGSCPGSCQHVWNYAQALPLLFPDLERSMRESHLKYGMDENGGLHFRLGLPLGIRARKDEERPCVDGSFGEIMKCFREWKVSGDTGWLKRLYPFLKQTMEYTWSPLNPDRWDPACDGVLTGRQHHTLDMELFGPSGWLQSHYLGALKAMETIAAVCGDAAFAARCAGIYRKGRAWTERELFNGEYYIQKIDLDDAGVLRGLSGPDETPEKNAYWNSEYNELKYQIGGGCAIDSHLGQWYASLYGIGDILAPSQIKSVLQSVFRYNFYENLREFTNTWRVFALEDEGGTIICSWPGNVRKPVIPLPYNTEMMTGFEWAAAGHCIMCGMIEPGEKMIRAIRRRYDGSRRNPWNEIECGSNYARSMASYALLQCYSGFRYDMSEGMIGFAPVVPGDFRCFWSLGKIWGNYEKSGSVERIRILYGSAEFKKFALQGSLQTINGLPAAPADTVRVRAGDRLEFF